MKKLLSIPLLLASMASIAQVSHTIVLRPGPTEAYNATIWKEMNNANTTDQNIIAEAWTAGGAVTLRSAFKFSMPTLPPNATFVSATLYLYGNPTSVHTQGHSSYPSAPYGTTNEGWLKRIVSPWALSTVSWSNMPVTTNIDSVGLPASTGQYQNYVINVNKMVKNMLDTPSAGYGFLMTMQNESTYRALIFGSSAHPDSNYRPKLVINYTTSSTGVSQLSSQSEMMNIYPNPANDKLFVELYNSRDEDVQLQLVDMLGHCVAKVNTRATADDQIQMDVANLPRGMYVLKVIRNNAFAGCRQISLQ